MKLNDAKYLESIASPVVFISTGNSKLGKFIGAINLPAGKTCNPDAPCRKYCYAIKGHYVFASAKSVRERNLNIYKTNPKSFFNQLSCNTAFFKFVRWHDSGDIVDTAYLEGMCKVARENPDVRYLAFTKQFQIVNNYLASMEEIPQNLTIVFSTWGNWIPENPFNLPMTFVRFKVKAMESQNEKIPENAFQCPGDCKTCGMCWKLEKGDSVVFNQH